MNYRSRNRQTGSKETLRYLIPTIIFILLFGLLTFAPSFSKRLGQSISAPIRRSTLYLSNSLSDVLVLFYTKAYLIQENQDLQRQLYQASLQVSDRNSLEIENQTLKQMLGRVVTQKEVLVAILSRPVESPYDTLIIDGGSSIGLKTGDQVFAGAEDIGYIGAVYKTSAEVTLYSSSGQKNQVEIGSNHVQAEADGQGGGTFVSTLPRDVGINVGDPVIDESLSGNLLGAVSYVDQNQNDPFQNIYFSSSVNLTELRYLSVVIQ